MPFQVRGNDHFPPVQFHGELEAPPGFDALVTVGVSLSGPVALWSSRDGKAELHARYEQPPGGASFARTVPGTKPTVALAAYAGSDVVPATVVRTRALPVAHPHVDMLADGSFLVAGARCGWAESGPELNALAIDQNGRILRRGCLGDGIEHLQVSGDGTIWAGYFDEGVFGNMGWGGPGPQPLGAGGVAAWSPDFEKTWELDPAEGLVADCYALNVGTGEVLACPYTGFPVVRIQGHRPRPRDRAPRRSRGSQHALRPGEPTGPGKSADRRPAGQRRPQGVHRMATGPGGREHTGRRGETAARGGQRSPKAASRTFPSPGRARSRRSKAAVLPSSSATTGSGPATRSRPCSHQPGGPARRGCCGLRDATDCPSGEAVSAPPHGWRLRAPEDGP
jgi:hypothetical protein